MIVTELEAKSIACPFARDFNASLTTGATPKCRTTDCMSWDWVDSEFDFTTVTIPGDYSEYSIGALNDLLTDDWYVRPSSLKPNVPYSVRVGTTYHPPVEEQQKAYLQKNGDMIGWDSMKLSKQEVTHVGVQRLKANRNGQCGRVHYIDIAQG